MACLAALVPIGPADCVGVWTDWLAGCMQLAAWLAGWVALWRWVAELADARLLTAGRWRYELVAGRLSGGGHELRAALPVNPPGYTLEADRAGDWRASAHRSSAAQPYY